MAQKRSIGHKNSNIELLRTVSMLMIVAYHYSIMGFYAEDIIFSANKSFVDIFGMGGKIGTDIFVMITGYYMINSRFTLRKLVSFMGQIWFYTLGALAVFVMIEGPGVLDFSLIKLSVFPLLTSHYWFASYYVLLMLLSPFINTMLHNLNKRQHAVLALMLFVLCAVLPEFFGLSFSGGSLWLFVSLYIAAAWIGLHTEPVKRTAHMSLLAAVTLAALCAVKIVVSNHLAQQSGNSAALINSVNFMGAYSPFAFVIAFLLLLGFCCREPRADRAFFVLGGVSFGVYLFHANVIVNEHLYQGLFHTAEYAENPCLFVHALCTTGIIYMLGAMLDLLRQKLFAPLWNKLTEALVFRLEKTKFCALMSEK